MNLAQQALLEKRNGWDVGRDPRRLSREELLAAGHKPMSPLKALRARCLDCCADQPSEVRLCTAVTCPSWPFRMGSNPWLSEAQKEAWRQALKKAAEAKTAANRGGVWTASRRRPVPVFPPLWQRRKIVRTSGYRRA